MKLHFLHDYIPVSVQYGRMTVSREQVSLVLERCWCTKTRTRTLIGHWGEDELGIVTRKEKSA